MEVLLQTNVAKKEDLGMDFGAGDQSGVPMVDRDLEAECNPKELERSQKKSNIKNGVDVKLKAGEEDGLVEVEDADSGDQFMSIKPWKGVVDNSVPSNYKPSSRDGAAPDATL